MPGPLMPERPRQRYLAEASALSPLLEPAAIADSLGSSFPRDFRIGGGDGRAIRSVPGFTGANLRVTPSGWSTGSIHRARRVSFHISMNFSNPPPPPSHPHPANSPLRNTPSRPAASPVLSSSLIAARLGPIDEPLTASSDRLWSSTLTFLQRGPDWDWLSVGKQTREGIPPASAALGQLAAVGDRSASRCAAS
uniref:Uncharacterized protein n=1 Tax=Coccidioides posadasii RMSCC 3488 TaxID=454284 RepID=A0A0J6FDB0_COCPO|nr:hypothetical protein CPAG_03196 [Coccidioides posadasii RMSCC 3488]